jgi:adenylate kinase family enzyme
MNTIVEQHLKENDYKQGCITDGLPRTIAQAETLYTLQGNNINGCFKKRRV